MGARLLCVRIPGFASAAVRRAGAPEGPWAVLEGTGPRARVLEVDALAAAEGVQEGWTPAQARALCPDMELLPWPGRSVAESTEAVEALLRGLSPQVDAEGRGVFFVGCRGLGRLYGPDPERGLCEEVARRLAVEGWSARLGLADSRFVAFAVTALGAARGDPTLGWWSAAGDRVVVRPGQGRAVMASLPLSVLPLGSELTERLLGLGIETLGGFAALPAASVEARYGTEGLHFHRLARGEDDEVLRLRVPDEPVVRVLQVEAVRIEQLRAPLMQTLEEIMEELRGKDRAALALAFVFQMQSGEMREMDVATGSPTTRAQVFWDLLALGLSRAAFPDRVIEVEVEVRRERQGRRQQASLFGEESDDRVGGDDSRLREVMQWLRARYGAGAVVLPRKDSTYRPERRRAWDPCFDEAGEMLRARPSLVAEDSSGERGAFSPMLRLLDPPLELAVGAEDGRLETFRAPWGSRRILATVGPQRLGGEWWDAPFERDYYEVLTRDGGLYWLFYDRRRRQWFLQGVFD